MNERERADAVYDILLTRQGEQWVQPRIERTQKLLDYLDNPQRTYRVVHVTGTNGKTSTSRIIESLIRAHGLRTGMFTSPHLERFTERILIDGEPVGATNRVPLKGEARSNLHVGGQAQKTDLTKREHDICAAIGPALKERGMIFVGIDVIGGYLTEINVTSPTGLQEINGFDNVCLEAEIWNAIEEKL